MEMQPCGLTEIPVYQGDAIMNLNLKRKHMVVAILGGLVVAAAPSVSAQTLQEAVQETLQTNPDVLVYVNERMARDQQIKQARSGYLPTVDVLAGVGREDSDNPNTRARGYSDGVELTRREVGVVLRQTVFDGFATPREVDRQRARVESSAFGVYSAAENTALRAAEVYLEVLRRAEALAIAKESLKSHERINDQIKLRSASGVDKKADLEQITGRLALAQSNVVAAEVNLQDAETNFLRVVGAMPENLIKPTITDELLPKSMDEAIEQAVSSHPTLMSADADIKAAQAQHEAAAFGYYPRVELELSRTWDENLDGLEGDNEETLAMLRLRYNLFRGGYDSSRRGQTTHLLNEAREVRNNTHRQVVESIRLSWMAHKAAESQLLYLEQHVKSTENTRDAYQKQFNIGQRTLLDVLDTETEVFDAKRAYLDAQYDGLFAKYRILNGMGRMVTSVGVNLPPQTKLD